MTLPAQVRAAMLAALAPPPMLTVSEWADRYRRLSPESAVEPGRWRTDRAPYQAGIMDAVTDPKVREMVEAKHADLVDAAMLDGHSAAKAAELREGAWLVSLDFEATTSTPRASWRAPGGKMVWLYQAPLPVPPGESA